MDKLVEKIAGLSYELFGVLIPGILFLILSLGQLSFIQFLLGYDNIFSYYLSLNSDSITPFMLLCIGITIYFTGQLINQAAEFIVVFPSDKIPKWHKKLIYFLMWPILPSKLENYNYKTHFVEANEILKTKKISKGDDWTDFFGPASRILYVLGTRSMISTYQNKYTLHRTSMFIFSITARALIPAAAIYLLTTYDYGFSWAFFLSIIMLILINLFLSTVFRHSFIRFWKRYGDQICWEIVALEYCIDNKLSVGRNHD